MAWYKIGAVSITNGQTSVTGVGTKWATNARVGDGFRGPDGEWYEVSNIASETTLGIYPAYQGATVESSTNYMIAPLQGYNKESADRLRAITDTLTVVTSVAGRIGDVLLTKNDVGLDNVDNTSDLNKPISTATQTQLDNRTPTTGNVDQTAGRLIKVGDYGKNGGTPIDKTGTDTNLLTVEGLYYFASGTNTPTEASVIHHIPTANNSYAKQIAYATTSNVVLQRVKNNGVWGSWTPTVTIVDNTSSTSTTSALSANQGSVINTALSNRYTKAEIDSTYAYPGLIEGLTMSWVNSTTISIGAGSAYVPSVAKIVKYAGGSISPQSVNEVNSFIHLYLNAAGTISQSLTVPVRYYNQASQMTGDNSRRYIGSLHVRTNALGVTKFTHITNDDLVFYTLGDPQSDPFRFIAGVNLNGSISARSVVPVTAHTIEGAWQNTGTAAVRFTPSDAGTSATVGWFVYVTPGSIYNAPCPIAADGTITLNITSGGVASAYCTGYYFNR